MADFPSKRKQKMNIGLAKTGRLLIVIAFAFWAIPLFAVQSDQDVEYDVQHAIEKSRQSGNPVLAYVYDSM